MRMWPVLGFLTLLWLGGTVKAQFGPFGVFLFVLSFCGLVWFIAASQKYKAGVRKPQKPVRRRAKAAPTASFQYPAPYRVPRR